MKNIIIGLFVLSGSFRLSAQCMLNKVNINTKIEHASLIVEGKVIAQKAFYNSSKTFIYTAHTIELYKQFKGNSSSKTIEIITEGGAIDGKMVTVSPSMQLLLGDVGIFMLIPKDQNLSTDSSRTAYKFYSGVQGFIKYHFEDNTATDAFEKYSNIENELYDVITHQLKTPFKFIANFEFDSIKPLINKRAPTLIINFSPTTISSGTESVLTINGSGFGNSRGSSSVKFKNADDAGKTTIEPFNHQYLLWSDNQIKVIVPSNAGTGKIQVKTTDTANSLGSLTISYAELSVDYNDEANMTRLSTINDQGGVTWRMSKEFNSNNTARESFGRALEKWSCQSNINWKIGPPLEIDSIGNDDLNVIIYNQLDEGTLAACYNYWYLCDTTWFSGEMDMLVGKFENWQYGSDTPAYYQYDFESVILHELGHGHQLGHVIDTNDLMHYSIRPAEMKRSIGANNIAAANDVMSRSVTNEYCGFGPMIPLNTTNCSDIYAKNVENKFKIFPNPSNGYFTLAIPDQKQNLVIECYNLYGAKVKSMTSTDVSNFVSIDLSDLNPGLYVLVVNNGEQTTREKLIIGRFK